MSGPTLSALPTASRRAHGLVLPVPISGHPCLELCNTRAGWGSARPKEYLTDYPHLAVLAADQKLLSVPARRLCLDLAAADPHAADLEIDRAWRVRGDLYQMFLGDQDPMLIRRLNADLLRARRQLRFLGLSADPADSWVAEPIQLSTPLDAFLRSLERLLMSGLSTVTACPGHDCGWLFSDPGARRRWCSMRWCGNRAKVARHAARASGRSAPS